MPEAMRRMSSIPDPAPIFDHRSQMRRVDKQYQMLKKRLIIAGSKVRERLLKEMRGIGFIQGLTDRSVQPKAVHHVESHRDSQEMKPIVRNTIKYSIFTSQNYVTT